MEEGRPNGVPELRPVSGPTLEKVATEEGKKMKAEATVLSDGEYQKFRQAAVPLWEEWGKKSPYCGQLLSIAKRINEK